MESGIRIWALKQPGEIINGGCGVNAALPFTVLDIIVDGGGKVGGDMLLMRETGGDERGGRKERGGSR